MTKRSIVYIDGFNLYYGALRGTPYKWLNLQRYFTLLRTDDDLHRIHYFTAEVSGPSRANQTTYLKALDTLPLVNTILDKFKAKQLSCGVQACPYEGNRRFRTMEEKRTDVHIAVRMLDDAYQDLADRFILVSGDSDLVPAVTTIKGQFPEKEIIVYIPSRNPARSAAVELRAGADKARSLPQNLLRQAQFPPQLPDGAGHVLTKPSGW